MGTVRPKVLDDRSPIPTRRELIDWYEKISSTPGAARMRKQVSDQVPKVRTLVSTNRAYAAARHGTIDGETPLCGRIITSAVTVHDPVFTLVRCLACKREIKEEGFE